MIRRYTLPRMGEIWSEENKYRKWLAVELAACEARAKQGEIPPDEWEELRRQAPPNLIDADFIRRAGEIEEKVRHDVIAFTTAVAERVGPTARHVHYGMTSSDVVDTGLALQMVEAGDLLLEDAGVLRGTLREAALREKTTPMVGRTHGVHAEPTTLGLVFAAWYAQVGRDEERLRRAREEVRVGQISGAVGTYAHLPPWVEEDVCRSLGLEPDPISTQIIQRDRHAAYLCAVAIAGGTVEKMALDIRGLARTEVRELEEPFRAGQKGSSAMPHKRNPISCEQLVGLSRLLRGNLLASLEDMALWHQRDISHSSVERVILPDSTILLDYMLVLMNRIIRDLTINRERMRENLGLTRGMLYSERVLLALVDAGVSREEAYRLVQGAAAAAWRGEGTLANLLAGDPEVTRLVPAERLVALFDPDTPLPWVDHTFARLGLD